MPEKITNQVFRLTPEAYKQIERMVQAPMVGDKTTDLQAGFQLGIQHVLKVLRDGYTIGT